MPTVKSPQSIVPHVRGHDQESDDDQCGRRGLRGDDGRQRREDQREQEETAGHQVREARTGTLADARRGLHEAGVGGGGAEAAAPRPRCRRPSGSGPCSAAGRLVVSQPGLLADADDGAHRVEEAGEQNGEDEQAAGQHADFLEAAEEADLTDQTEVRGADDACPGRSAPPDPTPRPGCLRGR